MRVRKEVNELVVVDMKREYAEGEESGERSEEEEKDVIVYRQNTLVGSGATKVNEKHYLDMSVLPHDHDTQVYMSIAQAQSLNND